MKKIVVFLLLCFAFSFAEEVSDTISVADTVEILNETEVLNEVDTDEISENGEVYDGEESAEISEEVVEEIIEEEEKEEVAVQEEEFDENRPTTLTVITAPENASVLINRRRVGNSPFTGEITPDETHAIMILRDGFELFDTTITLRAGAQYTLSVALVSENAAKAVVESEVAQNEEEASTGSAAEIAPKNEISEEDAAANKNRMNRIGIIVFLSIMLSLVFMQEFNNR